MWKILVCDQNEKEKTRTKFQNKLLSLTIVCALSMFFSQFYLITQLNEVKETNDRQRLEITVYKDKLEEQQEIHKNLNETNRNLVGQNNFLESQNKMLMEENGVEK